MPAEGMCYWSRSAQRRAGVAAVVEEVVGEQRWGVAGSWMGAVHRLQLTARSGSSSQFLPFSEIEQTTEDLIPLADFIISLAVSHRQTVFHFPTLTSIERGPWRHSELRAQHDLNTTSHTHTHTKKSLVCRICLSHNLWRPRNIGLNLAFHWCHFYSRLFCNNKNILFEALKRILLVQITKWNWDCFNYYQTPHVLKPQSLRKSWCHNMADSTSFSASPAGHISS